MAGIPVVEETYSWLLDNVNEDLLSICGTLLLHELFYFGWYIPFYIAEQMPSMQKYKVQKNKLNTSAVHMNCFRGVVFNHFVIEPILIGGGHFFLKMLGMRAGLPLPPVSTLAAMVVGCFIVEDFYFYWVHRLLHAGFWYQYIHKIHHEHAAPFGMAAEYAHFVEVIFLGMGTILGPLLFCRHMFALWVWLFFRLYQTVEAHCGYEFPWAPSQIFPLWAGAEYHDYHHETFTGNFASTFKIWDYVFGTDVKYYRRKQKRAAQAAEQEEQNRAKLH